MLGSEWDIFYVFGTVLATVSSCAVLVCTTKGHVWRKVFCAWFQPGRPCSCKTNSLSLMGGSGAGWEGTAILHHGSYIRVGCLQFVFSIVDQASQELLPPPRVKPPEQMSLLKTHLKAAQWYLPPPHPTSVPFIHELCHETVFFVVRA